MGMEMERRKRAHEGPSPSVSDTGNKGGKGTERPPELKDATFTKTNKVDEIKRNRDLFQKP